MVSSISSTGATQAAYPIRASGVTDTDTHTVSSASAATLASSTEETSTAATQSAESAAAARLGEQLGAQADAARVQRAVDEGAAAPAEASQAGRPAATGAAGGRLKVSNG